MSKSLWIAIIVILAVLLVLFTLGRAPSAGKTDLVTESTAGEVPAVPPPPAAVSGPTPPAETGGAPTGAETTTVSMTGNGFSPATVSVGVGGSVTFMNDDTASHQVSSNPHPLHTIFPSLNGPVLDAGGTFSLIFPRAGTFSYHDHLNPGLTGTVVVR